MMQGCTKAVSCLRPKKDTKYTLNIEASAQSRLRRRETSKYIYMKSERVSGMLGVESSSNSDSPPHQHRLQTRCFPGWVWGFLFYCYGVHGGNTMNCELWEPKTKIIQTSHRCCGNQIHKILRAVVRHTLFSVTCVSFSQQDKNRHAAHLALTMGFLLPFMTNARIRSTDSVKHLRFFIGVLLRCILMDC